MEVDSLHTGAKGHTDTLWRSEYHSKSVVVVENPNLPGSQKELWEEISLGNIEGPIFYKIHLTNVF